MGSEVDGANLKCDSFFLNGLRAEGNYINHVTKEMHQTIKHKHILHYKRRFHKGYGKRLFKVKVNIRSCVQVLQLDEVNVL